MAGSGLKELLEFIYASKAVEHIPTGKAFSRAECAHLMLDSVLNVLLHSKSLDVPLPKTRDDLQQQDVDPSGEMALATDGDVHQDLDTACQLSDS